MILRARGAGGLLGCGRRRSGAACPRARGPPGGEQRPVRNGVPTTSHDDWLFSRQILWASVLSVSRKRTGKSRCISSNGIYLDANSPASAHVIALAAFLAGRSTDMIGTSAVYKRRKQHPSLQGVFVFTTTEPTLFFWLPSHTFPLADTTEPAPPTIQSTIVCTTLHL